MTTETEQNDAAEEVIEATETPEEQEPEDRGDAIEPDPSEASEDDLKAVAGEDEDDPAQHRIPKARFDEVNERMKRAEADLAEMRARLDAQAVAPAAAAKPEDKSKQFDIDEAEDAYLSAIFEGKQDEAKKIRREINNEIQRRATSAAEVNVEAKMTRREATAALQRAAAAAVKEYPFLDSNNAAEKNDKAIADVVEWREFYISRGEPWHVALEKAVAKVAPMYAEPEKPAAKEDERKPQERRAHAEAARRQPPSMSLVGTGERSSAARNDPEKMTEEEFSALPASEKKRMRGD